MDPREKWNRRFAERSGALGTPERFIMTHLPRHPCHALDLASGDGRHAIALAEKGFDVTAVDIAERGLERLESFAKAAKVEVETQRRDLEGPEPLEELGPFGLAIIGNYKPSADLWAALPTALEPNALVILSTFHIAEHERHGFPLRFCLEDGELKEVSPDLELILYRHDHSDDEHVLDGYVWRRR